jgi:hypothetical protein
VASSDSGARPAGDPDPREGMYRKKAPRALVRLLLADHKWHFLSDLATLMGKHLDDRETMAKAPASQRKPKDGESYEERLYKVRRQLCRVTADAMASDGVAEKKLEAGEPCYRLRPAPVKPPRSVRLDSGPPPKGPSGTVSGLSQAAVWHALKAKDGQSEEELTVRLKKYFHPDEKLAAYIRQVYKREGTDAELAAYAKHQAIWDMTIHLMRGGVIERRTVTRFFLKKREADV